MTVANINKSNNNIDIQILNHPQTQVYSNSQGCHKHNHKKISNKYLS